MTRLIYFLTCIFFINHLSAQQTALFTHMDTLRGSITPERAWWDLTSYDLKVRVNPAEKSLSGTTTVHYRVVSPYQTLQIDLQPPLHIDRITQDNQVLTYRKDGDNAYMISLIKPQMTGHLESIVVAYSGVPRVAKNAPWDGGVSWAKDDKGNDFIATSCQGLGSSVWWACKDHMYDEPDSMHISVTVPPNYVDVSNGRLRHITTNADASLTYDWAVVNPINNYGVNMNVAQYTHFSDTLHGEKGVLDLDYYVLPNNLAKAKNQFKQVKLMLRAFEHWFGAYPFYEDGYKLVEVPYLGMEHQSSVTYGNKYENGYLGTDLSGTGWGLKWDFIIIHESGHEWFANNITYKDIADMWVHEGFTAYSEGLYTEFYYGKKAGSEYIIGTRNSIVNDAPIIGNYNVNKEGSSDMYFKGSNMLHTIRQIANNDVKWREILRGLNKDFYHKVVTTEQIETYISNRVGRKLNKVFDQYLRTTEIPTLEYSIHKDKLTYRWSDCLNGFDMPVKIACNGKVSTFFYPTNTWQTMKIKGLKTIDIDKDFYVTSRKIEK